MGLALALTWLPAYLQKGLGFGAVESGQFEVAVPDWFNGVFEGKYKDVSAFLDGTIAFVRSQPA